MIKPIAALFLGACLAPAADAKPADPIEPPVCEHPYPQCGATSYALQEDRCENTKCASLGVAPVLPRVYCTYVGSGYDCELWPRGPEMHYTFSTSGPVQVSDMGPTYQSNVWVQCNLPLRPGGVLSVTVFSPSGLASPTKTVPLSCQDQQEH